MGHHQVDQSNHNGSERMDREIENIHKEYGQYFTNLRT